MNIRERLGRLDGPQQMMWVILIWLLLASVLWVWWDERTLPDIRGRWASPVCEKIASPGGVSRVKRELTIDEAEWSLKIDFYDDEDCAKHLFSLDVEGPYDLGPNAMVPRDATTARFDLRKMTLTPRSEESAAVFQEGGCGASDWKVGEGQAIAERGCLGLTPTIGSCPAEYDIVKIEGGALYLGDRSLGMCVPERYPKAFAPAPLRRFDPETDPHI